MEIRRVRPVEYDAAGELVVRAYEGLSDAAAAAQYEPVLRDVERRAALAEVLVAVNGDDRILGSVTYVDGPGPYAETDDPDEAGIRMLAVAPEAQGAGIGRALVESCIERAKANRRRRIGLVTRASMAPAHRIYERLGFRRTPDRDFDSDDGLRLLAYVLDLDP